MKRTLLATALTVLLASALAPAFASDPVCRKGTIEMAGIKQPILGFAWEGQPAPLSKGIMFETLLDRRSGVVSRLLWNLSGVASERSVG